MKGCTMGVKCRAALGIVFILLLLGTLWLHGNLESPWDACLKHYSQHDKGVFMSNGSAIGQPGALELCPGQTFQIALLLSHLQRAPVGTHDVLLEPYLSSWDELIKFLTAMGPLVGPISSEIETKTSIIRELSWKERDGEGNRENSLRGDVDARDTDDPSTLLSSPASVALRPPLPPSAPVPSGISLSSAPAALHQPLGPYDSVRSMIATELSRGQVNFQVQTDSGCRTLLRLHRALLWLQVFLHKLGEGAEPGTGRLRAPSDLCREAYKHTLAQHHAWWVRHMAELAFLALPERAFFYRLICVQDQPQAAAALQKVVQAIGVVYNRTQAALEEHNLLALP